MITLAQLIAALIGPLLAICLNFRQIFVGGLTLIAVSMALIGLFAKLGMNSALVITMMVDLAIYQLTMGNYMFVYIGSVAEERSASIALFLNWTGTLILMLTTIILFQKLGNEGTFWLFAVLTFLGSALMYCLLREIKGLSQEEIKQLYVPNRLRDNKFIAKYVGTPMSEARSPNPSPLKQIRN